MCCVFYLGQQPVFLNTGSHFWFAEPFCRLSKKFYTLYGAGHLMEGNPLLGRKVRFK